MFKWLKKTSQKVDDALEQTKQDLNQTAGKIQAVLDESSNSVKIIGKVVIIALGVSIITNCITIFSTVSSHKLKTSSITIQNLYLGGPNNA